MTYDISPEHNVTQIVPGSNLFANPHLFHCGNLTSHVVWLCTRLTRTGFHLRCQPLLTLANYLGSSICKDLSVTIEVKLLRIDSLCALGRFEEALLHFHQIVSGKFLPNPADFIRSRVQTKVMPFSNQKPLSEYHNQQTLQTLCSVNVNQSPYTNIYGRELCYSITLCQAKLLVSIAELIYELPTEPNNDSNTSLVRAESQGEKPAKDVLSATKSKSQEKKTQAKRSKDKRESISFIDVKTIAAGEIKWKLLDGAVDLVKDVLKVVVLPPKDGM